MYSYKSRLTVSGPGADGDNYHREKRHVSPKASHLARDGADADVGPMAVVGWAVFKRASSILVRNKDKDKDREREERTVGFRRRKARGGIWFTHRFVEVDVLCEKTLWCIVEWLSGDKVLITACAILTRLVSWYDRPFSTNCEKSPGVNGQTMRLRNFELTPVEKMIG